MTTFSVPARYQEGVRVLRDLTDEQAEGVVEALEATSPFRSIQELRDTLVPALPDNDIENAEAVLDSLLAISTQARARAWNVSDAAARVAESVASEEDEAAQERLGSRLKRCLVTAAIKSTALAAELTIQHERSFRSARILSDIRPIFGEDVKDFPTGAVVIHTLNLSYWTATGQREAMAVVLDQGDLEELKDVVDRALDKATTLRGLLEGAGLTPFEIYESEK